VLKVPNEAGYPLVTVNTMYHGKQRDENPPFYISLSVNGLQLNNCMLDSMASTNVMSLNFIEQIGLKTTHPYGNACRIDSKKVKLYGLIEDVEVCLHDFHHISLIMNIVVIDILDFWGIILSRSWVVTLGGFLRMDLTYVHIPMGDGTIEIMYNRQVFKKHMMDLNHPNYHNDCELDVP